MACALWCLFAFAAVFASAFLQVKGGGIEERTGRSISKRVAETELVNTLQPIHSNQSAIMFWRPQKVGSSTILSVLVSYAYRFNVIPRRKSPLINSLCLKMAKCALHDLRSADSKLTPDKSLNATLDKYLTEYIGRRGVQIGSPVPRRNAALIDRGAETQSYKMSSSHQICSLKSSVVKDSIKCIFPTDTNSKVKNNLSAVMDPYITDVKELFVVRDPLSRAISVYYFWGELFKMHKVLKVRNGRKKGKRKLLTNTPDLEADQIFREEDWILSYGMERESFDTKFWRMKDDIDEYQNNTEIRNEGEIGNVYFNKSTNKSHRILNEADIRGGVDIIRLGGSDKVMEVNGSLFRYHGDEGTVPNEAIALAFANNLPYNSGMPGPSYTWSVFSNTAESAIQEMKGDRIMTIVTERLDESLVVASHYFGWSIADVVVTVHRKALSKHPKHTEWPTKAVRTIEQKLSEQNEYEVYSAANMKLNSRIKDLKLRGVNFTDEVRILKVLKERVTKLCMSEEYLVLYREKLKSEGYLQHNSNNKLRDGEDKYTEEGHCFSFNSDIMYSYDICGNCEAHAMLLAVRIGLAQTVDDAPTLAAIDKKYTKNNPNFAKCP